MKKIICASFVIICSQHVSGMGLQTAISAIGTAAQYVPLGSDYIKSKLLDAYTNGNTTQKKTLELRNGERAFADLEDPIKYQPEIIKAATFYGSKIPERQLPDALQDDLVALMNAITEKEAHLEPATQMALYDVLSKSDEHDNAMLREIIKAFIAQRTLRQYYKSILAHQMKLRETHPFPTTVDGQLTQIFPPDMREAFDLTAILPTDYQESLDAFATSAAGSAAPPPSSLPE